MKDKLLELPYDKWYDISSRSDFKAITDDLKQLVELGYHFEISKAHKGLFRRLRERTCYSPIDLFAVCSGQPGYEVRTRRVSAYCTAQELYFQNKLIAIK